MQPGASGGKKILDHIGRDLRGDEEIAAALTHADIAHGFPGDAAAHQGAEKIPVAGCVALEEFGPQAHQRAVVFVQAVRFQIVGQVAQHFPLRVAIAAEGTQPRLVSEKEPGHLQLPGGEETGVGGNAAADAGVYFIPELGQQQPVLGIFCNFFDIPAFHMITKWHYIITSRECN